MKVTPAHSRSITQLLVLAVFLGGALTLFAWLWPGWDARLFILVGVVAILGMVTLWQRPVSRPVWFLAVLAAVSLVYLFPTLFGPGCDGMPKALAGPCPPKCQITVCTDWDAPGENGCNAKPPDKGCCRSYDTTCAPDCVEDPPPDPDQPPSLTASLNCSLAGSAGWCRGGLVLDLTATESKGRQILISGDVNGTPFACPQMAGTATCSVPLPEGAGAVNYTATSDIGLSASGSTVFRRDSRLPVLTQSLTGSLGQNGWYVSGVTYAATATDATSGVSSLACMLDGAPQAACTVSVSVNGLHTATVQAVDAAGNTATSTQNIAIDTQAPSLSAGVNGTSGNNGWLKAASLNASASDSTPGSGLAALEYALDGGGWIGFNGTLTIPDGVHTLAARASDLAGQTSQSEPINVKVDSIAPALAVAESGTMGVNGWYVTLPTVAASVQETGSGLALLETSLDNGAWTTYTGSLTFTEGIHTLAFWTEDAAGWVTQETRTLQVDTSLPLLGGSLSGTAGRDPLMGLATGWYISPVILTVTASDPAPGSGLASLTYRLNGGTETSYTAPLTLNDGKQAVTLTALDVAGLEKTLTQTVQVDTVPPTLQVLTALPAWVKDTVTFTGSAADGGSGLTRVEISFDNGNTWQTASGTANWQIAWDTRAGASGGLTLRVRAVDAAGLSTTMSVPAQVDNTPPRIDLPAEWNIWETVTFDAHDGDSGLDGAELIISDPQNRWPKRIYTFAPGHLPVDFTWDRRFADGTLAPLGDYHVKATATDRMGNTRVVNATLHISLAGAILPPPAVSTPLGVPRPTATPTKTPSSLPSVTPTASVPTVESPTGFGETAPASALGAAVPPITATLAPRATPTPGSFSSWVASIFNPQPTPAVSTTEITDPTPLAAPAEQTDSNILWGAAAVASVGAFAAYIAQKKREEEAAAARRAEQRQENEAVRDRQLRKQLGDEAYFEYKQAQELKVAIAAQTEKEQKAWKAERYAQISQTETYKNSDNKTAFMHNELASIKAREQQAIQNKFMGDLSAALTSGKTSGLSQAQLDQIASIWKMQGQEAGLAAMTSAMQTQQANNAAAQAWANRFAADEQRRSEQEKAAAEAAAKAAQLDNEQRQSFSAFLRDERETNAAAAQERTKIVWWDPHSWPSAESWLSDRMVEAGRSSKFVYDVYGWMINSGINDPNRNPDMVARSQGMWDGIHALQDGIVAWSDVARMRQETTNFTLAALRDGRLLDFGKGLVAQVAEDATVAGAVLYATATGTKSIRDSILMLPIHAAQSVVTLGGAVVDRLQGKDRGWDVALHATDFSGDIATAYALAKPVGLIDDLNAQWSKAVFGRAVPDRLLPAFFKDTFLNNGAHRTLLDNLVNSHEMLPSAQMTAALLAQNISEGATIGTAVNWKVGMPGRPPEVKPAIDPIKSPWYRQIWGHPNSRFTPASAEGMVGRLFDGDMERFSNFINTLDRVVPENTRVIMRGSGVNGYKWVTGRAFDGGNIPSDIDLVLVGDNAMKLWPAGNYKYFGNQTPFVSSEVPKSLSTAPDLYDTILELERQTGRGVNFVGMTDLLYEFRQLVQRTPIISLFEK